MNEIYRLIWSRAKHAWMVVSDKVMSRGAAPARTVGALCAAALLAAGSAHALPSGGQVAAGQAAISQPSATRMQIDQASSRAVINWNSFGIGAAETVNISQPSSQAALLNRVIGNSPSEIYGRLTANGQVFLVNPSGVLFAPGSSINVGGLVASSLTIANEEFLAGTYRFSRDGKAGSVINRGDIAAGFAALLGPSVENSGSIVTSRGSAALGAADAVTLNFDANGLIALKLDQGAYNALVDNSGIIEADGGRVLMTARSADDVMKSMVNTTGRLQARTVESRNGEILLLGDTQNGTVSVAGVLDASAPAGGNGGLVETSAASVKVADTARVTTAAPQASAGTWLIDPDGFTIAPSGGDMTGTALSAALSNGNVSIASTQGSGSYGNIIVDDNVSWNANRLTLTATTWIYVNKVMTAGGTASLDLEPGNWDYIFGRIDFPGRSGTGFLTISNNDYSVINSLAALQEMGSNLSGNYAMGDNIDASATGGGGFVPVGSFTTPFTGRFDGLGHAVTDLTITQPATDYVGLFGIASGASILNVNLNRGSIQGNWYVGGLVGRNNGGSVHNDQVYNVTVTGNDYVGGLMGINSQSSIFAEAENCTVTGNNSVGGLVGRNFGAINGYVYNCTVTGNNSVGGLVGSNYQSINSAGASNCTVTGNNSVGGLVGFNSGPTNNDINYYPAATINEIYYNPGATIDHAYATGTVTGSGSNVGGLVGQNGGGVSIAYATGAVAGGDVVGGLVGLQTSTGHIEDAYATGAVTGGNRVGGLVGEGNYGSITTTYATGKVTTGGVSGGLVASNLGTTINNGFWDIDTTGQAASAGGTGIHSSTGEAFRQETYSGFDFAQTWRIYQGHTYPLLKYFLTPLTMTSNSVTKTYDGTPDFTGNITYSRADIYLGWLFGGLVCEGTCRNVGNYKLIGDFYSNQQGYDITFIDANAFLTVTPAPLKITTEDVVKTYDGTVSANGRAIPTGGTMLYDTDTLSGGVFAFNDKNVVNYDPPTTGGKNEKIVTVQGVTVNDQNDGRNYYPVEYVPNTTSTVNPAPLTVTAQADTKTYDRTTDSATTALVTAGRIMSGDTAPVWMQRYDTWNAGSGKTLTPDPLKVADGNDGGNYAYTYVPVTGGTVYPAYLALFAAPDSRTYDGTTTSAGQVTYSGLMSGDSLSGLSQSFVSKNALGTNGSILTVNLGYTLDDGNSGHNYVVVDKSAGGTITPAQLSLTAVSDTKIYDGTTTSAGQVTYSGLMSGDSLSGLTQSFTSPKPVIENGAVVVNGNTLVVDSGYALSDGNGGKNYAVTRIDARGTIYPLPPVVAEVVPLDLRDQLVPLQDQLDIGATPGQPHRYPVVTLTRDQLVPLQDQLDIGTTPGQTSTPSGNGGNRLLVVVNGGIKR